MTQGTFQSLLVVRHPAPTWTNREPAVGVGLQIDNNAGWSALGCRERMSRHSL